MRTPEPATPGYRNLSGLLEKSIPVAHLSLLKTIAETAHEQHQPLYIVGGFVRDLLLEHPSLDFDLVVKGDAIPLAKALARKHGGRITTHARFGTAKWQLQGSRFQVESSSTQTQPSTFNLPTFLDLITARTEFYTHPTALPTIKRGSIKLDLQRRDFTINTLGLRLDGPHYGELHDYWGGNNDLRQGLIRVLHSASFLDDPTRMFRAVRFEQRFGFQIEARTLELLQDALSQVGFGTPLVERVSGDRIRHELDHLLDEPKAAAMLTRLDELGLLKAIHPDLPWDERLHAMMLSEHVPGSEWGLGPHVKGIPTRRAVAYTVWFAQMSTEGVGRVSQRLKLPQALEAIILSASVLKDEFSSLREGTASMITARLDRVHPLALFACFIICEEEAVCRCIYQYVTLWQHIHSQTDGNVLRAAGLPPGPVYTKILGTLRAAWLDGGIHSAEEEKKLLETLLAET